MTLWPDFQQRSGLGVQPPGPRPPARGPSREWPGRGEDPVRASVPRTLRVDLPRCGTSCAIAFRWPGCPSSLEAATAPLEFPLLPAILAVLIFPVESEAPSGGTDGFRAVCSPGRRPREQPPSVRPSLRLSRLSSPWAAPAAARSWRSLPVSFPLRVFPSFPSASVSGLFLVAAAQMFPWFPGQQTKVEPLLGWHN